MKQEPPIPTPPPPGSPKPTTVKEHALRLLYGLLVVGSTVGLGYWMYSHPRFTLVLVGGVVLAICYAIGMTIRDESEHPSD